MNNIYMDNAATTKIRDEVFEVMLPYLKDEYGNPSSIYKIGQNAKNAIEISRVKISNVLNCDKSEIFFTSGGTESNNWAIKGICDSYKKNGNHIITVCTEHHSVLNTCKYLEKQGYEVTYLKVDSDGLISIDDLENAIKQTTILITIMFANNEIGTIQPIKKIGEIAKKYNIIFHTDAVQALGHIEIDVKSLNIDLMTITSHKIYGPKGIGALYINKNVKLGKFLFGGAQEKNKRAGTENVSSIVGMGEAVDLIYKEMELENKNLTFLRNSLVEGILKNIPFCKINGCMKNRLPGNVNISFDFIEGESLLLLLDMKSICASSGSACTSGSLDPSHVLLSIGLPHEKAHGSLRLSLGRYNTVDEVDKVIEELIPIVKKLRDMSPLYEKSFEYK